MCFCCVVGFNLHLRYPTSTWLKFIKIIGRKRPFLDSCVNRDKLLCISYYIIILCLFEVYLCVNSIIKSKVNEF
jgi:hypothetical protein